MANSLITRCPKCSTAFRVNDDVLSMAKGKVRCGQCFHIFDAQKAIKETPTATQTSRHSQQASRPTEREQSNPQPAGNKAKQHSASSTQFANRLAPPQDDLVNPEWLHTLFNDDDLTPPNRKQAQLTPSANALDKRAQTPKKTATQTKPSTQDNRRIEEPAPWEVELAEVEAALNSTSSLPPIRNTTTPHSSPPRAKRVAKPAPQPEPDYMVALHSLAQSAAEQTRPSDRESQHSILEQLSAQESLAPLLGEDEHLPKKKSMLWLWFLGTLIGLIMLVGQVAEHFFEQGSRSANFRAIYQTICTYSGCKLPRFEDVSAITIEHVRVQSHPTRPNALLVNAIITNTSPFSQPMPKMALEFFDLNGAPVAARLFAPSSYLHKDFLDITYMPPNTPIHLVIPIQDPGARAVTHQLRAFPSDTRSY